MNVRVAHGDLRVYKDRVLPAKSWAQVEKERGMLETAEYVVALYVDQESKQWVVRDREGNFWALPTTTDAWENRLPFELVPDKTLVPIPGHYRYTLDLPF